MSRKSKRGVPLLLLLLAVLFSACSGDPSGIENDCVTEPESGQYVCFET
jgi:hypothetical protein